MMPPRIDGFRICQSLSAALVTVTKSEPKNTRSTPSTANSRLASGERLGVLGVGEIQRPLVHDHAAGEKLQGRRIGRLLGLDEQTYSSELGRSLATLVGTGPARRRNRPGDQAILGRSLVYYYGNLDYVSTVTTACPRPPSRSAPVRTARSQRLVPGNPRQKRRRKLSGDCVDLGLRQGARHDGQRDAQLARRPCR